jgi:hypothetical protein
LAIVLGEKSLGPDHPFVSDALYNLAVLYARQNRFADAEPLLIRALGIRLRQYGPGSPAVQEAQNALWLLRQISAQTSKPRLWSSVHRIKKSK